MAAAPSSAAQSGEGTAAGTRYLGRDLAGRSWRQGGIGWLCWRRGWVPWVWAPAELFSQPRGCLWVAPISSLSQMVSTEVWLSLTQQLPRSHRP